MNNLKNNKKDLKAGSKFGDLVVLEKGINNLFKCYSISKKEIVTVSINDLSEENKKTPRRKKQRIADINEQYQRLTVTDNKIKKGQYGQILIQVRCSCGTQKYVKNYDFVTRKIASCGCIKKIKIREATKTHGLYKSKEYQTWLRIKTICLNENDPSYERYGAIGIKIDPKWIDSFQTFYKDMGPCPEDSIITRIDPEKGFFSYNCCWLSRSESKKIQILIECGANPEFLMPSKPLLAKNYSSFLSNLSKEKIKAIRTYHAKGESNLSVIAKEFEVSVDEIVGVLVYSD